MQEIQKTMTRDYIDIKQTAAIIRAELKKAFPETKFSIRLKRYSGGSHVSIHYTDGPPNKAVEAITDQFYGRGFDGMTDCSTHHDTVWNGKTVHFAGSRPSVYRSYSSEDTGTLQADDRITTTGAPHDQIKAILKRRMDVGHWLDGWQKERRYDEIAWQLMSHWDARFETFERLVQRYLGNGIRE